MDRSSGEDWGEENSNRNTTRHSNVLPFGGIRVGYTHEDFDVKPGKSYRYKLEDITSTGSSTLHGPVRAVVGTIRLVSPESGASTQRNVLPYFIWESTPYDRFRIELAAGTDFSGKVVTIAGPKVQGKAQWIRDLSHTPTADEWKRVKHMLGKGKTLYWRVFGEDGHGCSFTSEANVLRIKK